MPHRFAYMPLITWPDTAPDASVLAAAGLAAAFCGGLNVSTFAVDIPHVSSPLGSLLLDVEALARVAEARSQGECQRLQALLEQAGPAGRPPRVTQRGVVLAGILGAAATEARYHDLTVVPWSAGATSTQDLAQALVFGSGRPVVLVPPTAQVGTLDHLAIAWDQSPVAARALNDALPLLSPGGRITVLTVMDEKSLGGPDLAQSLAASLDERGYSARARDLALGRRSIAEALQFAALDDGAGLLAMGGFGHSRLREFILGGATRGVFADLQLPTLLAH